MRQEIDPHNTSRSHAFELWIKSPMPMVTLVKTFDVSRLYKLSRKSHLKFNMLLCWCIGKSASGIDEFYMIPSHGCLYKYDRLAVNVIVDNADGGISNCDIPFSDDLQQFSRDYDLLTEKCRSTCTDLTDPDFGIVGTSAITSTELDCIVNQYSGIFNNPFLAWGRFKRHWLNTYLTISFQFHHAQMDGGHAAQFLERLQELINEIKTQLNQRHHD